jgi:PadR family transcriptional regulator, regulatory protein PadR
MSPTHDSQILKGVLGLVLLRLIDERESYGYELVERVHALGLEDVPDGSIYPALGRLERDGHVTSQLVRSPNGPARKYYRVSSSGREFLTERSAAWAHIVKAVTPILNANGNKSTGGRS